MQEQEKEFVQISLERYNKFMKQVDEMQQKSIRRDERDEQLNRNIGELLSIVGHDLSRHPLDFSKPIEMSSSQGMSGVQIYLKQK